MFGWGEGEFKRVTNCFRVGVTEYMHVHDCRPMIQLKLKVLHQAGLAKEDFSEADSTTVSQ